MPGYALSPIFRAKMRDALARAGFQGLIDSRVWQRRWTVHVQQIGNGQHATLYLSRYIYRVALSNHRLERFTNHQVTFSYTHARTGQSRRVTLPAERFLARFLQHVLPRGFPKVRSYGLLSPGCKPALEYARSLLQRHAAAVHGTSAPDPASPAAALGLTSPTPILRVLSVWLVLALAQRCPICHRGQHVPLHALPRQRSRGPP